MVAEVGGRGTEGRGGEGGGESRGLATLRSSGLVFPAPQAVALRGRAAGGGRKSGRRGPLLGPRLSGQRLLAHTGG